MKELQALVDGYATAADAGDADGFAALFLPDGTLTVVPAGGADPHTHVGHERLARIPLVLQDRYDSTAHVVGETAFSVDEAAGTATGTAACVAHHVSGDTDRVMTIRYDDTFRRHTDGAWRFASRRVVQLVVEETVRSGGDR